MRGSRWMMAVLFLGCAVLMVEAQQPRQRQGGFAGGFGGVDRLVLSNTALQEELKLTADQKAKFKGLADKQAESFKNRFSKDNKDKGNREEARKEGEKLRDEIKQTVDSTLTADQKKRLKQIELQQSGMRAFTNEEVAAQLKLTDGQKSKIKSIADDHQKDVREIFGGRGKGGFGKGGFDQEKMAENQKKIEKLTKAAKADIEDVLNSDQKNTWKEMTGEPFDVSKLRTGFPGGFQRQRPQTKD